MTDQELVDKYLEENRVTHCPPALARGIETSKRFRKEFNGKRASERMKARYED